MDWIIMDKMREKNYETKASLWVFNMRYEAAVSFRVSLSNVFKVSFQACAKCSLLQYTPCITFDINLRSFFIDFAHWSRDFVSFEFAQKTLTVFKERENITRLFFLEQSLDFD